MHLIAVGIGAVIAGGYFIDKTGEGVNDASTGLIKMALTGALLYYGAKKLKVVK